MGITLAFIQNKFTYNNTTYLSHFRDWSWFPGENKYSILRNKKETLQIK